VPDLRDDVRELFGVLTGHDPDGLWSAPGRVVLFGDQTADDGVVVLSFAIDRRTIVAAGGREDAVLRVASTFSDQAIEIPLAELDSARGRAGWADYPLGVAWALGRSGADLAAVPGVDLVIESNVPVGAGLASSAALVSAVALALNDLWRLGLTREALARVGQLAENDFAGVPGGLADPSAVLLGRADSAVLLDRRGSDAETIPFDLAGAGLTVLVLDTGTADGALEASSGRERHVATENERVRDGVRTLRDDGPTALGPLLDASHASRRDAGRSTPELDLAVETARENGALGARATGGGSAIALTPLDAVSRIQVAIDGAFAEHGFAAPEVFAVRPSDGAARDA
jgi:galactokinase